MSAPTAYYYFTQHKRAVDAAQAVFAEESAVARARALVGSMRRAQDFFELSVRTAADMRARRAARLAAGESDAVIRRDLEAELNVMADGARDDVNTNEDALTAELDALRATRDAAVGALEAARARAEAAGLFVWDDPLHPRPPIDAVPVEEGGDGPVCGFVVPVGILDAEGATCDVVAERVPPRRSQKRARAPPTPSGEEEARHMVVNCIQS